MTTAAEELRRSAIISPCGRYRYRLERTWSDAAPVTFIMLNPSTADAEIDDPTIRRCMGFARSWGAGGIIVANLFALRATDPTELEKANAPIGTENDTAIVDAILASSLTVAAWGAHKFAARRAVAVKRMIVGRIGGRLKCLGRTKSGHPRHPLYVPASQALEVFP